MTRPRKDTSLSKHTVLLVEDDIQVLSIIRSVLSGIGFENVIGTGDGGEAMRLIDKARYSLVICDWTLPGKSGLEILQHHRKKWGRKTPFIMVTGMVYEDAIKKAIEFGVTAYIAKPFQIDEMESKIISIVNKMEQNM